MQKPSIVAAGQWWKNAEYPGAIHLYGVGDPVCLPNDVTDGMNGDLEGHGRRADGSIVKCWNLLTAPDWIYLGDGEQPSVW